MFTLEPMPDPVSPELLEKLSGVETATVGHFLHSRFASSDIGAVLPETRVAGTAVTVRIPGADSTLLHHVLSLVRPGDVLVIDRCGDRKHACWGGIVTNAAKLAGVVGAVIDGPATDFNEIRRNRMPIWCTGPAPITTKMLGLEGALNVPVSIGGTSVVPGDAVLADESGVLFLKPDEIDAVADRALGMQAQELAVIERLRDGEKLADMSGATKLVMAKPA